MTRRYLALAGMLVPVVFTLGWLVAGFFQENANVSRGTISDLGAETADKAWLWHVPLSVSLRGEAARGRLSWDAGK